GSVCFNAKERSLSHGAKLQLSDGNSIYAKLVVGTDGGKSHVRELARIKTTRWNHSQNAIICTRYHSLLHQETPCPQGGRYLRVQSSSPKSKWLAVPPLDCCPMKLVEEIALKLWDPGGVLVWSSGRQGGFWPLV
ncbi:hypothetical protein D0Y65_011453, partial [Glycine soja]